MPISNANRRKTGEQLIKLYLDIRTGARRAVANYRIELAAGHTATAEAWLLHAVNFPARTRARLNNWRDRYEAINGAGTFNAYISDCITRFTNGDITLAELNAALTALENQASTLKAAQRNATSTLSQIADWIDANWENEVEQWDFRDAPTFAEDWNG